MSTKRHGEKENRESFREEKNKELFEAAIDKNEEHVIFKKEEKKEKRETRELERRKKEKDTEK